MKVVINACYGGFSLSPDAVKRYAELKGRECYFFTHELTNNRLSDRYTPRTIDEARKDFMFFAFDVPNPDEVIGKLDWHEATEEQRIAHNALYEKHQVENRDYLRHDPTLIQVVEELGEKANGHCASLKIVEIPDGTDYEISEYDGLEHVAEKHRTWS